MTLNRDEMLPVHLAHCNMGDYEGTCKYGDADCPALQIAAPGAVPYDEWLYALAQKMLKTPIYQLVGHDGKLFDVRLDELMSNIDAEDAQALGVTFYKPKAPPQFHGWSDLRNDELDEARALALVAAMKKCGVCSATPLRKQN